MLPLLKDRNVTATAVLSIRRYFLWVFPSPSFLTVRTATSQIFYRYRGNYRGFRRSTEFRITVSLSLPDESSAPQLTCPISSTTTYRPVHYDLPINCYWLYLECLLRCRQNLSVSARLQSGTHCHIVVDQPRLWPLSNVLQRRNFLP